MNIGQKIKELRHENNLTQEQLAEQLGVSFQAVSRWENNTTYPDITLLPIIASMFNVTTDYLLDINSYKMKEEIDKVVEQDNLLSNQGKIKERENLLLEALKKYPNNWELKSRLLEVYHVQTANDEKTDEYYQQKAIALGNNILDKCNIDEYRYSAINTLCFVYDWIGEVDKAKKVVEKLPGSFTTKDYLMLELVKGDERNIKCAEYITTLVELFHFTIGTMRLTPKDRIEARQKEIKILNIIFDNDDLYFYNWHIAYAYNVIAEAYAYLNNKEEMLKNLEYAFKYAQKRDELQNEGKELTHESVLVKGYGYDLAKFNYSNELSHVELIKEQIKDSTSYNKYSNDPDFIRLINKY